MTVHSFFSLLASEAGLANGEHIGLPGDEAEGDAGTEDAGVGSGVGSLREEKSDSDNGNVLSGHGGTGGQTSSSFKDFSDLSVEEDLRCGSLESEKERWNFSMDDTSVGVGVVVADGDKDDAGG